MNFRVYNNILVPEGLNMKYRDEILRLRAEGFSYNKIVDILGCSKSTVSFHCGEGQKEKYQNRQVKNRAKEHPFKGKLERFIYRKQKILMLKNIKSKNELLIYQKIIFFHKNRKAKGYESMSFNLNDIITKFGENTKCYLTGKDIDIYQPKTYNFDHIIPVSKGGTNTLDNLGICTKVANQSKSDLSLEEFYRLCEDVLKHRDSKNNN